MKPQTLFMILLAMLAGLVPLSTSAQYLAVPGVSTHGQGAGVAIWDLDNNGAPDMIVMAYHNAKGTNLFRYKVGKDLGPDGTARSWSGSAIEIEGVGRQGEGAGVAIGDINMNGRPDLLFLAYDAPKQGNSFRYKVGWDLNEAGIASSWSGTVEVEGVGDLAQGAGAALADIDGNGILELLVMAYDNPEGANSFRYRIGWNLNAGAIAANWTAAIVPGVSNEADGAGAALADLDGNDIPDLLLLAYVKQGGQASFRAKIGWNLDAAANPARWTTVQAPGMGAAAEGAGVAFWDMQGNGSPEMILMAYDASQGGNSFRYRVTAAPAP